MKYLALIVVLCLPPAAVCGTFEIADPAGVIYEEFEQQDEQGGLQTPEDEMVCIIDDETNRCSCINKESRQELSVKNEVCAIRALNISESVNLESVD